MVRRLTSIDVQAVTGYTRYQFKGLMRELAAWFPAQGARVAREFTPHDLTVFGVVRVLDSRIGMRRKQIGPMIPTLRKALLVPREVERSPYLAISFDPVQIEYVSAKGFIGEGVLISLGPINDVVDRYLGVARSPNSAQENHTLPPTVVPSRRRRTVG